MEVFATNFCWRFPRKPLHNNTVCDIHIYDNRGMISQYLALKAVIRGHPIQKLSEILVNPYSPLGIKSPSWLVNTGRLPLAGSSPAPRRRGLMAFSSFSSTSSFFFFCFLLGLSAQLTQVPSWLNWAFNWFSGIHTALSFQKTDSILSFLKSSIVMHFVLRWPLRRF